MLPSRSGAALPRRSQTNGEAALPTAADQCERAKSASPERERSEARDKSGDGWADVDPAVVLHRYEWGADRHDHLLDERVDLVLLGLGVFGRDLDLDLADGLCLQPCLAELLQQTIAIRDSRCLHRDVFGHEGADSNRYGPSPWRP